MKKTVAIIGPGVVGCAIAKLLAAAGYEIAGVAGRTEKSAVKAIETIGAGTMVSPMQAATADIVFITTPDDAIAAVCAQLAAEKAFHADGVVLHCSGALPASVLTPASNCGAAVAALHPLQTFASAQDAILMLPGAPFAFEGDEAAKPVCAAIVHALAGWMFPLAADKKPIYHAAACIASNYLLALEDVAAGLMAQTGLSRQEAAEALLPLIEGTVRNLRSLGAARALTGPIARGDDKTVAMHMDVLMSQSPELFELYKALGRQALRLAQRGKKIRPEVVARLAILLE